MLNKRPLLGVIIPALNEERTVGELLLRVLAQPCVLKVVVIDDGSSDRTREVVQAYVAEDDRVALITHPERRGKGASIRTALSGLETPLLIIQDADLEYDPSDYARLLEPIMLGEADVVYGSRFMSGAHTQTSWGHKLKNRLLTSVSNLLTGLRLTDEATCYKVFHRDLIRRLNLQETQFGFCPEFTAKISQMKLRVKEVPISYRARSRSGGKKLRFRDGLSAVYCLFKYSAFYHSPRLYQQLRYSDLGQSSCRTDVKFRREP
jgi:glycosyltransferase involved in cell wall biosynthesis